MDRSVDNPVPQSFSNCFGLIQPVVGIINYEFGDGRAGCGLAARRACPAWFRGPMEKRQFLKSVVARSQPTYSSRYQLTYFGTVVPKL